MEEKNLIAIEIGSSKIKGAIGAVDSNGTVTLSAVEEQPLVDCVRHGQVTNIKSTGDAIRQILRKIENRISPRKVEGVYLAIGGRSVMSYRKEAERRLRPETEITQEIIDQLKTETFAEGLHGREVLDVLPKDYLVDNKTIEYPIGVYGSDIKMISTVIACKPVLKKNLRLLFDEKLGLKIEGYVVRQLAEADVVLTTEEKRLGCMLVDFGAETVAVSIYKYGKLQYLVTIPIGSRHITRDITTLNFLEEDAETIKRQRGNAGKVGADSIEDVEFANVNNMIRHRAGEIIVNIKETLAPNESIDYPGFKTSELPAGIIIVGRGAKLAEFNTKLSDALNKISVRAGGIMTSSIRIADGRIHPSDAIDVISILYGAARQGAKECLSTPPVVQPHPDNDNEQHSDETKEPGNKPKEKSGFWKGFTGKIKGLSEYLKESEENEDDFNDDDE